MHDQQYKDLIETIEKSVTDPVQQERIKSVIQTGQDAGISLQTLMLKLVAMRVEAAALLAVKSGEQEKVSENFTELLTCASIFLSSASKVIEEQGKLEGGEHETPSHLLVHVLSLLTLFMSINDIRRATRIGMSVGTMLIRKAMDDGVISADEFPKILAELMLAVSGGKPVSEDDAASYFEQLKGKMVN